MLITTFTTNAPLELQVCSATGVSVQLDIKPLQVTRTPVGLTRAPPGDKDSRGSHMGTSRRCRPK